MAIFPSDLPCPLDGTASIQINDGIVEDSGEIGLPRKRRRTTRALKVFSFTLRMTYAQQQTWATFYQTTINYGLTPFTWAYEGVNYTVELGSAPSVKSVTGSIKDYALTFREV
ncbi:hypothetical protein [Cohaesibacter gelatinilyticus]|uniref:Uncharacterized protein n=1 Tax=Cohaesibacter gelatinilyticus TaxID=372072 RepID=A0A285PJ30_9HYPH|nr:hypothetical protein [Cohaesibacter gelatinilyticus]SNZ21729.1 hypothetical protein SAMN06265368_4854 [Cohaesibacter gelatinilyticus]